MIFAGKSGRLRHSTTSFSENVVVAEKSLYLSNRKRFASLHSLI